MNSSPNTLVAAAKVSSLAPNHLACTNVWKTRRQRGGGRVPEKIWVSVEVGHVATLLDGRFYGGPTGLHGARSY